MILDWTMDDFENMSEFSPFTWQPVYSDGSSGELMDFNAIENQSHLSNSRGMLETIVEETSDDEENGLYSGWSGSDSFSSGSSETGSVVRVDIANGGCSSNLSRIKLELAFYFRSRQPRRNLGARFHLSAEAPSTGSRAAEIGLHSDDFPLQSATEPAGELR